jgi:hypothetical protein
MGENAQPMNHILTLEGSVRKRSLGSFWNAMQCDVYLATRLRALQHILLQASLCISSGVHEGSQGGVKDHEDEK